jgi:hypothetical protein
MGSAGESGLAGSASGGMSAGSAGAPGVAGSEASSGSGGGGPVVPVCPVVEGASDVADPWKASFIGTTCQGQATLADGKLEVTAVGGDAWGASDSFTFVSQPFTEADGEITAKITGDDLVVASKIGVMFRSDEAPNAAMAFTYGTLGDGSQFLQRAEDAVATPVFSVGFSGPYLSSPVWVKTVKRGDQLSGFASRDGEHWLQLSTQKVTFKGDSILAGLAVAPNNAGEAAHVRFEDITLVSPGETEVAPIPVDLEPSASVEPLSGSLEGSWKSVKLGAANAGDGFGAGDDGAFSITSVGADIWGKSDGAGFIYTPVSGDFDFVAKVDALETYFEWAKAGIMLRASLMPDAANVNVVFAAPGVDAMTGAKNVHGVCQQRRLKASTETTSNCVTFMAGSGFFKLSRRGQEVTGYVSRTGDDWFPLVTEKFAAADLPEAAYVGIAAANHQAAMAAAKPGTARFSHVALTEQ